MQLYSPYSFTALSNLFEQLSDLLQSGINLNRALMIIHDLEKQPKRQQIIQDIIEYIQAGMDFSHALQKHPGVFAKTITELIKAGEKSGTLGIVLQKIVQSRKILAQIKASLYQALSYPVILLVVALGVIAVLLLMVIPQFADMFAKFNAPLPPLTQFLLDLSDFFKKNFWHIIVLTTGFIVVFKVGMAISGKLRLKAHALVLFLPIIGKIVQDANLARFSSVMQLLLAADIKLLPALEISSNTVANQHLADKIRDFIEPVQSGADLSEVVKESDNFHDYALQMLIISEETGDMAGGFAKIGDYHQKRIEKFILHLKTFLEPSLIIFVSLIIGIILFGMYQPIFKLNQLF